MHEGRERTLIPTVGIFITLNPSYVGRNQLPESVKVLFRPINMIVPDFELIMENLLLSVGFKDARALSR